MTTDDCSPYAEWHVAQLIVEACGYQLLDVRPAPRPIVETADGYPYVALHAPPAPPYYLLMTRAEGVEVWRGASLADAVQAACGPLQMRMLGL
jgi:hypothetical protein